jgi:glucose-6-phosphate isomerase
MKWEKASALSTSKVATPLELIGLSDMWPQCATIHAAALHDVNPLDQPGVELGKRYTGALLGRQGMDVERAEFDGVEQGRTRRITV